MLLILALGSPLIMVIVASLVAVMTRRANPDADWPELFLLSWVYGLVGAGASLAWTILHMETCASETGYDCGNAPLGWIFLYGPLSFACGQTAALVQWWMSLRRSGSAN